MIKSLVHFRLRNNKMSITASKTWCISALPYSVTKLNTIVYFLVCLQLPWHLFQLPALSFPLNSLDSLHRGRSQQGQILCSLLETVTAGSCRVSPSGVSEMFAASHVCSSSPLQCPHLDCLLRLEKVKCLILAHDQREESYSLLFFKYLRDSNENHRGPAI